ncbi:tetratricopeptide repeat protein, partial [Microcoleus sp. herbarium14]|uniref:tetratricopeptide repeat protein n=1 Tax=Microcoleus sp. herbarium14 TaxID=3055439 RepID=UPI002FD4D73D
MIRQIWQRILNLLRQIQRRFRKQPAPPPPKPTRIWTSEECEQKFLELLEGVAADWSRGEIKGFLIGSKIKDAEWENWLQEFESRLLVSPETHLELGGRMVRLGELNCGKISEVAGNIGRELLSRQSLTRTPAEESSQIREDIQELPEKTEETGLFRVYGGVAESLEKEISQEAEELYNQAVDNYEFGYLESALACYDKVIEMQPDFYEAWINRSKVLDRLGRYQEATTNYYRAIALQSGKNIKEVSQKAVELCQEGLNRYDAGDLEGAITAFEKALEIDPKFHYAWNGLGATLGDLDRNSEAIAAYDKALEI